MTPSQEKKLDQTFDAVSELKELLAGSIEQKGLVHVVRENDKDIQVLKSYKRKDEKFKAKVAGGIFVSIPIFGAIIEYIKSKLQ